MRLIFYYYAIQNCDKRKRQKQKQDKKQSRKNMGLSQKKKVRSHALEIDNLGIIMWALIQRSGNLLSFADDLVEQHAVPAVCTDS